MAKVLKILGMHQTTLHLISIYLCVEVPSSSKINRVWESEAGAKDTPNWRILAKSEYLVDKSIYHQPLMADKCRKP